MDPDHHAYGMRRARGVRRARGGLYARAARAVRCALEINIADNHVSCSESLGRRLAAAAQALSLRESTPRFRRVGARCIFVSRGLIESGPCRRR